MLKNKETESVVKISPTFPRNRHGVMTFGGWGYKHSYIKYDKDEKSFSFWENNKRKINFIHAYDVLRDHFKIDYSRHHLPPQNADPKDFSPIKINERFIEAIKSAKIDFTDDFNERFHRSFCQTMNSLFCAKRVKTLCVADLVVFPNNHNEVVEIIKFANEYDVILIPIGGATNVTDSNHCPQERRSVIIVDCTQMNRMLWIDETNLLACFESGIVGQDIEKILNEKGYTCGHEPDSIEFSTLGGWIATRASGMKRAKYGNIEEVVKDVKFVTSIGTLSKKCYPRVSHGPEVRDLIFGSEGNYGIITEAVIKIHHLPQVVKYGSIVFPTFETGIKFMHEMSKTSLLPASLRLIDNEHYKMGLFVRQSRGIIHDSLEPFKRGYLWYIKGFDENKIVICSYKIEGTSREAEAQEQTVIEKMTKFNGVMAGEYYGKTAYNVTMLIGYIRDVMEEFRYSGESMETSIEWSNIMKLVKSLESLWKTEVIKRNYDLKRCKLYYRISQVYKDGVCFYMYFNLTGDEELERTLTNAYEMKNLITDTFVNCGGSISHHHGIGKKYKLKYFELASYNEVEIKILRMIKKELDPKNIFAVGNAFTGDEFDDFILHKL